MQSAIKSLVLISRQHGVDLSQELLEHDYSLGDEEASDSLLVQIASENGLKARQAKFSWEDFIKLKDAFPIIARLNSGQSVIVTGYRPASDDGNEDLQREMDEHFNKHQKESVVKTLEEPLKDGRFLFENTERRKRDAR